MALITINGVSLDPVAQSDALRAARLESAGRLEVRTTSSSRPAGPSARSRSRSWHGLGVEIQEYVPENTYLCGYGPSDLTAIRALPFVTWADVYLRGVQDRAVAAAHAGRPRVVGAAHDGSALALAQAAGGRRRAPRRRRSRLGESRTIAAAAGVDADDVQVGRRKVRLTVQEGELDELAALDEVRHIEEVPTRQLFNNVARPILERGRRRQRHHVPGRRAKWSPSPTPASTRARRPTSTPRSPAAWPSSMRWAARARPRPTTRTATARTSRLGARRRHSATHGRGDPGHGAAGAPRAAVDARLERRPRRHPGRPARPVRAALRQRRRPRPHQLVGRDDARARRTTRARARSTTSSGTTRTW